MAKFEVQQDLAKMQAKDGSHHERRDSLVLRPFPPGGVQGIYRRRETDPLPAAE